MYEFPETRNSLIARVQELGDGVERVQLTDFGLARMTEDCQRPGSGGANAESQ